MKEWKKRSLELYQYMPMAIKQWRHWVKAKGRQTIPQKSLGFELHVCEQCNLKCRGCDNFSCLVKENNFYDINVFRKDLLRLKELFENHVERITLLGGEPLLNPELGGVSYFCKRNFSTLRAANRIEWHVNHEAGRCPLGYLQRDGSPFYDNEISNTIRL